MRPSIRDIIGNMVASFAILARSVMAMFMEWLKLKLRNLVDIELTLSNDINYFVGNAVGKSNFLDLS